MSITNIVFKNKQHSSRTGHPKIRIVMLGPSLEQNGGIATIEKLILKYIPSEVEIQHICTHDEGSVAHRAIVFGQALGAFLWRLLHRKTELVHMHLSERGSVLRKSVFSFVALMFGKPVLLHANGAEFQPFFFGLPKWAQLGVSFMLCRCTVFMVVTKTWEEFYLDNLGLSTKQVLVLPNPVELPAQVPHRTKSTKVSLIFLGRIGQRKGAFDLIKAFAKLPTAQRDHSQLILAGDGDIEQGCKLVESLGLVEHVTFLGWVSPEQREKVLAKADIFVLPSYNEGLPMALLEAMGWGLPVITTPIAGIPELVNSTKNGLLVNPGDIQQLSEMMQLLIENETLRLSLGNAARQTVAPYDVETYCCRLADVYRSILQPNQLLQENSKS